MFHEHHHRSIFPLVVVALTLGLLLVLVLIFWPIYNNANDLRPETDASLYQNNVVRVLTKYEERSLISESYEARYDVTSSAMSEMLGLVVPKEYQNLHLNLVISLDTVRQGCRQSDDEKIKDGENKLSELKSNYQWL
jgi:hypothetical protein